MFCSAETPPAQTLRMRPMRRTPAHPRRSSSKTRSLMLKTGHCRPHNSLDGLRVISRPVHPRYSRAIHIAKRILSCLKPAIAARITPSTAFRVVSRPVHPRYSRVIRMTKRSLSCLKPARIARASSPNASQTNCRARIAHPCPSSVHGLQSPLSASSSPISPS